MREGVHGRIPPVPRESRRGDLWEKSPPGGTGHQAQTWGTAQSPCNAYGDGGVRPWSPCPSVHPLTRCWEQSHHCHDFARARPHRAWGLGLMAASRMRSAHKGTELAWGGLGTEGRGSPFPAPAPSIWELRPMLGLHQHLPAGKLCAPTPRGARCPPAAVSAAFC